MRYRKPRQRRQPGSIRSVRQRIECLERTLRLALRKPRSVFEPAGGFDGGNNGLELRESAVLDRKANGSLLRLVSMAQGMDQRQCRFAFRQVITQVFSALGRVGAIVEDIVHEFVCGAEVLAIRSKRLL